MKSDQQRDAVLVIQELSWALQETTDILAALDREGHQAKEIERNRDVLERTRLAVDRGQPFESKPWR